MIQPDQTLAVETVLIRDGEPVSSPRLMALRTQHGANAYEHLSDRERPNDHYGLTLTYVGELWPGWVLIRGGLQLNPAPLDPMVTVVKVGTELPTGMLHYYWPSTPPMPEYKREAIPGMVVSVALRIPR